MKESRRVLFGRFGWQLLGVAVALATWWLITSGLFLNPQFSRAFSPGNTFRELVNLLQAGTLQGHIGPSLERVGIGLGLAVLVGIPLGVLVGYFRRVSLAANTVFQFVRMTSPLAWMPLAIILFGVGDKPVYFLIAIAAMWPMVINTGQGVRGVEPVWIRVVKTLGGGSLQILRRAVLPAIIPDMLTGLRVSLGISWIILVPAEMLGVSSGLGYFILDTRDRFDYGELMATILVVGFLGMITDTMLRFLEHRISWKRDFEQEVMA
jgi:NitT/TauT family transport system permease protein